MKRVTTFFKVNTVPADKLVVAFLSVVEANTYGLLRHYLALVNPAKKSIKELTEVLESDEQSFLISTRMGRNTLLLLPLVP